MSRLQTHVEYEILQKDAERGIHYAGFADFWERRMEPMQFISRDAKGPLAVLRNIMKEQAKEQWTLWVANYVARERGTLEIENVQSR